MAIWNRGSRPGSMLSARLREGAEEIAVLRSAHFVGATAFSVRSETMAGRGVKNLTTGAAHQYLTRGAVTTEAIIDGHVVFLRLDPPTAASVGKQWAARKFSPAATDLLVGHTTIASLAAAAAMTGDPTPSEIDGRQFLRLQAVFRPSRASRAGHDPRIASITALMAKTGADAAHIDLYLDDDMRLCRYGITWSNLLIRSPVDGTFRMSLTREYFDFDTSPPIVPPRLADVLWQADLPPDLESHPVLG